MTDLAEWQSILLKRSVDWFPETHESGDALAVFALGLAGETGETVDIVKKYIRDGGTLSHHQIADELADVFISLCGLASEVGVSLDAAVANKLAVLGERWGE